MAVFRRRALAMLSAGMAPKTGRPVSGRQLSSSASSATTQKPDSPLPPVPPARWLSSLRARIGKCIIFGCTQAQVAEASVVLRALATEWRQLTAGSEGFLTGRRRGLEGQRVAWGEMDAFGHVNNVVYNRYAETSRVEWVTHFAVQAGPAHGRQWTDLMSTRSVGLIMKSLKTEFKFPMTYPDTISVYHKLQAPPAAGAAGTSLLLECMVLSHQHKRIAAKTFEDVVIYDYKAAAKTEMPAFMRSVLNGVWQQQQVEAVRARRRIWELMDAVERLEKQTWDRPDAVEDTGYTTGGRASA